MAPLNEAEAGEEETRGPRDASSGEVRVEQIDGFLPGGERDALYAAVCENEDLFKALSAPGVEESGTRHWSREAEEALGVGNSPVGDAVTVLAERIRERLPSIFEALGVEPFPVAEIPVSLMKGGHGHSGAPHADSLDGRFKISLLYYFHGAPKGFDGGALEIYETDPGTLGGASEAALMRIEHEDNVLLAFRSETFHGVTEVTSDSEAFSDGRFVAVSFLG